MIYLAQHLLLKGGPAAAADDARAAIEAAECAGDAAVLAQALALEAVIRFFLGGGIDWPAFEHARELERERWQDIPADLRPTEQLATVLISVGRLSEARSLFDALHEQVRQELFGAAVVAYGLGHVELAAGRFEAAIDRAQEALEFTTRVPEPTMESPFLQLRSLALAHLGRVEEARRDAERALRLAAASRQRVREIRCRATLGFLELSLDNPLHAEEHLCSADANAEEIGLAEPALCSFRPLRIEALARLGRLDEAETLLAEFEPRARQLDRTSALAAAARCRGILAALRGDAGEAASAFADALAAHARSEQPFELARTLLALGEFQRRVRQKRDARETLTRAVALFEELGTRLWSERARSELGRIGGRSAPGAGELSATEARIAELVAQGRTNRQIAAALSLSPRTVQWNLSKVYRKAGVRSRAELAGHLASLR